MYVLGSILFQITYPISMQVLPSGFHNNSAPTVAVAFSLQHMGAPSMSKRKQLCATPPNSSAPTVVLYCNLIEQGSNATKRKAQQQFSHVPYDCCCFNNSSLSSSPMYRKQLSQAALLYKQFVLQSCHISRYTCKQCYLAAIPITAAFRR